MALANLIVAAGADRDQAIRLLSDHSMVSESKAKRRDYIPRTIDKAITAATPWPSISQAPRSESTPQVNAAAGRDAAPCPVQLAEALARIAELEAERDYWKGETETLREVMSRQARIRQNKGLGSSRNTALAVVNFIANRESAEALTEDGMIQVPVIALAEASGCGEDATRKHLERLGTEGHIRRELRPVPVTRVDRALLAGSRVRFVATATAGTDHVRIDELDALGA